MDKFEVYQNGNFVDGRPVFQIGVKQEDGSYAIVDGDLMSEEEANARLKELQPPKKAAAKKEPVKKAAKKKQMATSGTTAFNPDFTEIAEEAWERAGREMRSGYDLRTARRSMNLLTIEWQNRGINLWTIEEGSVTLTEGTSEYSLPNDTVDLLEHTIRTDSGNATTQSDLTISRISVSTYASIPNKLSQGRPIQVYIERLRTTPKINVWPVPDKSGYVFYYWRMRRIEDSGHGAETADMNFRFLPCLMAGLAYYISQKDPELMPRVPMLKEIYEEQFALAAGEDREKTSARFVPRIGYVQVWQIDLHQPEKHQGFVMFVGFSTN